MADPIIGLRNILVTNWSKPPAPSIEDIADLDKGDAKTQLIKLYEETGELSQSLLKNDKEGIIDAIGDSVVVLTNLAELNGVSIETCMQSAYDEISGRTGRMVNGTFVKD